MAFADVTLGDGISLRQARAMASDKTFRASFEAIYRDVFSAPQRAAIGAYVEALPGLLNLDRDDAVSLERAFERYWSHQR